MSHVPKNFDWATLKSNRAREIMRLNGIYRQLLVSSGVTLLEGRAFLRSAGEVEVNTKAYRARHVLVATGGQPVVPKFPGSELAITSNEIFDLPRFPNRLVIVGGGYIASEFASIFAGLGAQVIQLYRGDRILRGFDDDLRNFVAAEMIKKKVSIRTRSEIAHIERNNDGTLRAGLSDGSLLDSLSRSIRLRRYSSLSSAGPLRPAQAVAVSRSAINCILISAHGCLGRQCILHILGNL